MSNGQSSENFARPNTGPDQLDAEITLFLRQVEEAYQTRTQLSPHKALQKIMIDCHDAVRVLVLRLGQHVLDQATLLDPFDRAIASGCIKTDQIDRWVSSTIAIATEIATNHIKLRPLLAASIGDDRLLSEQWRHDLIAEIQAVFDLYPIPEPTEEEPDPWLAAAATMTQQSLPLGPQPTLNPPSGLPTGGAGRKRGKP